MELLPRGKLSDQEVTICQIDVKFYRFELNDNEFIKKFMEQFNAPNSSYFSIYYSLFLEKHHKVTFVNIKSKECQEAFDLIRYLR